MGRVAGTALWAFILAGLAGCGDEAAGAPAYVGRVTDQGQDAVIGVVNDSAGVSFYVCGGASSYATMTHWFLGAASGDGTLDLATDDWHVTGNLNEGAGKLETSTGATFSWAVRPVATTAGSIEGLYQTLDGACRTGAVVGDFGDGQGTRLQGTWCDAESHFAQVTPIKNPVLQDGEDIAVEVGTTAARTLVITRLLAPLPAPLPAP
jgi:hypothetical protein